MYTYNNTFYCYEQLLIITKMARSTKRFPGTETVIMGNAIQYSYLYSSVLELNFFTNTLRNIIQLIIYPALPISPFLFFPNIKILTFDSIYQYAIIIKPHQNRRRNSPSRLVSKHIGHRLSLGVIIPYFPYIEAPLYLLFIKNHLAAPIPHTEPPTHHKEPTQAAMSAGISIRSHALWRPSV